MPAEPDPKALAILFQTFWSPEGLKHEPHTGPDDLAYAAAAGYMFAPEGLTHDQVVARVRAAARLIPSDRSERECLINILGYCGILAASRHPSFAQRRVADRDRDLPPVRKLDWQYPVAR